ncbi:hypothetical protein C8J57DRAFT_1370362 [Mycena rebaudengoi]|nr:hypothetical protein C8J57DRAFT_1370362 [Mycena rebaudengoi]
MTDFFFFFWGGITTGIGDVVSQNCLSVVQSSTILGAPLGTRSIFDFQRSQGLGVRTCSAAKVRVLFNLMAFAPAGSDATRRLQ